MKTVMLFFGLNLVSRCHIHLLHLSHVPQHLFRMCIPSRVSRPWEPVGLAQEVADSGETIEHAVQYASNLVSILPVGLYALAQSGTKPGLSLSLDRQISRFDLRRGAGLTTGPGPHLMKHLPKVNCCAAGMGPADGPIRIVGNTS